MAGRSGARRFKLLGACILLVVVAWSMLWFIAATVVDRQVAKAEKAALDADVTLMCVNRSVTGFPFRIEVRCGKGFRAGGAGGVATLAGLTVVAQLYDPTRLIAEATGPLELSAAVPLKAEWSLAHASAELSLRDRAARQLIAEVKGLSLTVGAAPVSVATVVASVRRDPAAVADLDVYGKLEGVVPLPDAAPSTLTLDGTVTGGAAMLAGRPEALAYALAAAGLPIVIKAATFSCGDMQVAAAGELTLSPDGLLNGTVDVALAGYGEGVPYLEVMAPRAAASLTQVLQNVLAYAPETTIGTRKGKRVLVIVKDSQVRVGLFPVGRLPRVALAAR